MLQEKQLGQVRPADTATTFIYSPAAGITGICKVFHIVNTSGSDVDYEIYHDDDGTTYDNTTIIAQATITKNNTRPISAICSGAISYPLLSINYLLLFRSSQLRTEKPFHI